MAHFDNPDLGVSFDLPDKITVRHQLRYYAAAAEDDDGNIAANWKGALMLIENWQCADIPDPAAFDLDTEADMHKVNIMAWTAARCVSCMSQAQAVKKN